MKDFAYTLAAGEQVVIARHGQFFICTESTAAFQIEPISNDPGVTFERVRLENGLGLPTQRPFDKLLVTNDSGASNTITLYVADTRVYDNRKSLNITGTVTVEELTPSGSRAHGSVAVATTATIIAAAAVDRHRLVVTNHGAQTLYVGNSGVTTANGQPVPAGNAFVLYDSNALYGIVGSGTGDARYWQEKK